MWGRKRRERKDEGRHGRFSRKRNIRGRLWLTDSFYDLDLASTTDWSWPIPDCHAPLYRFRESGLRAWKWNYLPQKARLDVWCKRVRERTTDSGREFEKRLNERAQAALRRSNCFGRLLSNLVTLFLNKIIPSQKNFSPVYAWALDLIARNCVGRRVKLLCILHRRIWLADSLIQMFDSCFVQKHELTGINRDRWISKLRICTYRQLIRIYGYLDRDNEGTRCP
jgi:hypothetical protein